MIGDCLKCGKENKDNAKFCIKCGEKGSAKLKEVKWTFYVNSVDKDMFGTYTVLGSAKKPGLYDIDRRVYVN